MIELCGADRIEHHVCAPLSEFDLDYTVHIPPGGNWKDIPLSIEDKRLKSIRDGYKGGNGSRSTYYGRLHPDRPAYTISTYFTRPGNGCNLHYDYTEGQHRTLSAREGARLQSFPDYFIFSGNSSREINIQIGNAVPPVLAYQIAEHLGKPMAYVDLFCGAGGLSLGFSWAGWTPLVGNDLKERFTETYSLNVHDSIVPGDISEEIVQSQIVAKKECKDVFLIGGPPCQGFSTAGLRRSMEDNRNQLFWSYKTMLEKLQPKGFLFENVTGLLNMEKGEVLKTIKQELGSVGYNVTHWVLKAEEYGVPQRRTRVFIVGTRDGDPPSPPPVLTSAENWIGVEEALGDLPPLRAGQDGSNIGYLGAPKTGYQRLMRGQIGVETFLNEIKNRKKN